MGHFDQSAHLILDIQWVIVPILIPQWSRIEPLGTPEQLLMSTTFVSQSEVTLDRPFAAE